MLRRLAGLLTLSTLALVGCTQETLGPDTIDSLVITTSTSTVAPGAGIQLGLLAFGASGQMPLDEPSTWTSDNPLVASVSATGFVTGVSPGVARIAAHVGSKSTDILIVVFLPGCTGADGDSVSVGGSVSSVLTNRPCYLSGGYTAQGHIIRVTESGTLQADLTSVGFHPSLILTSITGGARRTAPSANGRSATLRASVLPGTYILWAATLGGVSPQENRYTIAVQSATGECAASPPGNLGVGEVRSVALSPRSCVLLGGPIVEGWRLNLAAPTRVRLVGASPDFPPMVAITDAAMGLVSFAEIFEPGTAELTWLLPAGSYRVWAGSFYSGAGALDVSLEEIEICAAMPPLAMGGGVNGQLGAGDCEYDGWLERYADPYLLTLGAPTQLQLDLVSGAFDPILFVTTLDGAALGQDDDSGEGLNARLRIGLPAGTYRVWATSYQLGSTGAYTLSAGLPSGDVLRLERDPSKAPLPALGPRRSGWGSR